MKLIKLNEEFYLLSTDEIKKGDTMLIGKKLLSTAQNDINVHNNQTHYKVIGATNPYNVQNSNVGVSLLNKEQIEAMIPSGEIDLEVLADKYCEQKMDNGEGFDVKFGWRKIFKEAYSSALQDTDKKFTEADMKKAMNIMIGVGREIAKEPSCDTEMVNGIIDNVIKTSFSEQTEWNIEIEMEKKGFDNEGCWQEWFEPKVTNGYINILKIK